MVTTNLVKCGDCQKGSSYVEYDEIDKFILLCTSCNAKVSYKFLNTF